MESFILVIVVLTCYFIPTGVAYSRDHRSFNAIFLVNFFLGWSILGWLWALIWANTGNVETPSTSPNGNTHVKCPDCAELVKREAKICKHCGCKLIPQ